MRRKWYFVGLVAAAFSLAPVAARAHSPANHGSAAIRIESVEIYTARVVERTSQTTTIYVRGAISCDRANGARLTLGIARSGSSQAIQPQNPSDATAERHDPWSGSLSMNAIVDARLTYANLPAGDYIPVSSEAVCYFRYPDGSHGNLDGRVEDNEVKQRGDAFTVARVGGEGSSGGGGGGVVVDPPDGNLMGRIVIAGRGVTIVTPSGLKIENATPGPRLIGSGSTVKTGASPATITFGDGSRVRMPVHASFTLAKIPDSPYGSVNFYQRFSGRAGRFLWKLRKGTRHRVHGAIITVAVRGTTFSFDVGKRYERLRVYEGSVGAGYRGFSSRFRVGAGQELIVQGRQTIGPRRFRR